ncbi:MAG: hypothetical protein RSD95_02835 [Clostridia bacterium]
MNRIVLLEQLKAFTIEATKDLIMPTRMQKDDTKQGYRAADVHIMRLPDSTAAAKKTPFIIHQLVTGKDIRQPGMPVSSSVLVRSIFSVYNPDEEEGALMLINLMERLRIALMKQGVIGECFVVDLETGVETLIYPDDTAPYYTGEMATTWILPAIKREVKELWQ